MAEFPFATDVGQQSYPAIIDFAHTSGVPFTVSSTYRPGDPGYHGKGNAVDAYSSDANMVKLAAWWTQYTPFLLELIHSGGGGFFVKNGKPVDAGYYGSSVVSQHYNHVHVAITNSGLSAARVGKYPPVPGGAGTTIPASAPFVQSKGCLMPTLTAASMIIGSVSWLTIHLVR